MPKRFADFSASRVMTEEHPNILRDFGFNGMSSTPSSPAQTAKLRLAGGVIVLVWIHTESGELPGLGQYVLRWASPNATQLRVAASAPPQSGCLDSPALAAPVLFAIPPCPTHACLREFAALSRVVAAATGCVRRPQASWRS